MGVRSLGILNTNLNYSNRSELWGLDPGYLKY
jgi:hypothetical protein